MTTELPVVKTSKSELLGLLQKMIDLPILIVGDLILDRYIWGDVDRISPEAPVPVVDVKRTEDRLGGAGNVARNLRNIGAKVSLCGLVGDDDEGKIALALLAREQIAHDAVMTDRTRPTTVKTRIMSQRQQIVRIDRESRAKQSGALRESFAALIEAHVEGSKAVIISDYGKGVISNEVMLRLQNMTSQGKLGLGARPLMVDPHPSNYNLYHQISLAKPNRKEAEAASGVKIHNRESALEAAQILINKWQAEMIVLSLGEGGLLLASRGNDAPIYIDTVAQEVFDVSGAGDAVVAIFTAAIAAGATPLVAGELANIGAGVVVSEVGTVPVNLAKLKREIERLTGVVTVATRKS